MHLLALRISGFLNLKPDAVLKHWACAKIMRSRPTATGTGKDAELGGDDEVCRLIVEKFGEVGGVDVSYADIAKKAWEVGRGGLATKVWAPRPENKNIYMPLNRFVQLLDHEPKGSDQVPLLLSMKEDKLALIKAVDSGDTDLGNYIPGDPPDRHPLSYCHSQSITSYYICTRGCLWAHSFASLKMVGRF